jgi:hypothetical protein
MFAEHVIISSGLKTMASKKPANSTKKTQEGTPI